MKQAGYTLLELLVVVAIIGLLAATLPNLMATGLNGLRLSGRVHEVTEALTRARRQAIETGKTVTVELTTSDRTWPKNAVASARPIVFFPDGSSLLRVLIVKLGPSQAEIRIDTILGPLVGE